MDGAVDGTNRAPMATTLERSYFRLYVHMMRYVQQISSQKMLHYFEVGVFVVALHLVGLLAVLHLSFVSAEGTNACLSSLIPPHIRPDGVHLMRLQIVPDAACVLHGIEPLTGACSQGRSFSPPIASYMFASERGYLSFFTKPPPATSSPLLRLENILTVQISRSDAACFGLRWEDVFGPLVTEVIEYVVGYDTIMMNHMRKWRAVETGAILNEATSVVYEMDHGFATRPRPNATWIERIAFKVHVLYLCVSLFFVCIALLSFVMKETQLRCLRLTDVVVNRLPVSNDDVTTLVISYFMQSLVLVPVVLGMLFFLLEVYRDHVLAFGVLIILSYGEAFSILCARTRLTQMYYPALFFCWFTVFHLYLVAFPYGFTHTALLCFGLVLIETSLFFTNCFEIPALSRREISSTVIRERVSTM
ncbi:hypothetical protein Poli38472_011469 [Pythium oligandrum]|uniref:Membralin n=1 Tax=Pythium oligandrum TaxID=41045 RepID=A0A8K1FKV6_PYTOL|nr:hypothetical protein Poli38472_011469 [Pythium oligandrum]|eukprot:TMW64589.1 hypothetical protein Poli38472_011469 [Pythium oligandrum]